MPKADEKIVEVDGKKYHAYNFPRPSVAVDCVVFRYSERRLERKVLLIKRKNPPYQDCWALPGGFMDMNETSELAARRELEEETSLDLSDYSFNFIGVFDTVDRDPRGRVIGLAYYVELYDSLHSNYDSIIEAQDDAKEAKWFDIDELPELAFDHKDIIQKVKS